MTKKSTRSALCWGLAGSLALSLAPGAQAQINVTGGSASGQAGFFIPTSGNADDVKLFDIGINQLQLDTANGSTGNAVFIPNAANFTATDGTTPVGGSGILLGTLSGVAFTSGGSMVPFTGVQTQLDFDVDSFTANLATINGSLIDPDAADAPLVFLPGVTGVSGTGFTPSDGDLQIGDFEASLTGGDIALSPDLEFRESSDVTQITPLLVGRRIKYEFEGENVTPQDDTDLDPSDDEVRFVGEVNKKFEIKSVGTRRSREFKFEGEFGAIDIVVSDPDGFDIKKQDGTIDVTQPIDKYKIEGEGTGITALFAPNGLAFSGVSDRKDTKLEFSQGHNNLELETDGENGLVEFYALGGVSDFNRDDVTTGYEFFSISGDANVGFGCNICDFTVVNGVRISTAFFLDFSDINFLSTDVSGGGDDDDDDDSESFFTFSGSVSLASSNLFSLSGSSEVSINQYNIVASRPGRIVVRTVRKGGDRYYIASRSSRRSSSRRRIASSGVNLIAFKQIGPSSRIFPGLTGLRQISEDELDDLDIGTDDDTSTDDSSNDDTASDDDTSTDDDVASNPDDSDDSSDDSDDSDNDDSDNDDDSDDDSDDDDSDDDDSDDDDSDDDNDSEAGSSQDNPVIPRRIGRGRFRFVAVATGLWCDPPMVNAYSYEMTEGSLFTSIGDFPKGIDADNKFTVSVDGKVLGEFSPGQKVDFSDYKEVLGSSLKDGEGVTKFTVSSIDPAVDGDDPVAFPILLNFNTDTATFEMQALE